MMRRLKWTSSLLFLLAGLVLASQSAHAYLVVVKDITHYRGSVGKNQLTIYGTACSSGNANSFPTFPSCFGDSSDGNHWGKALDLTAVANGAIYEDCLKKISLAQTMKKSFIVNVNVREQNFIEDSDWSWISSNGVISSCGVGN